MAKRPTVDLISLTSEQATAMPEALQRAAALPAPAKVTANLEPLNFKVSDAFSHRFRTRALNARLKLNELLCEALAAWEREQGLK